MLSAVAGLGQQRQQLSEAGRVVANAATRHHASFIIDHGDVMMVGGPVDSTRQRRSIPPPIGDSVFPLGSCGALMRNADGTATAVRIAIRAVPREFVVDDDGRDTDLDVHGASAAESYGRATLPSAGTEMATALWRYRANRGE